MIDTIIVAFNDNASRVENLLALYEQSHGRGRGRRSVNATDILRAAVVLLHATLEELLRGTARWRLPSAPAGALEGIPLVGAKERFTLGELTNHRGKTVDDVIAESVLTYLERSNYNSTREIASFLTSIGVDVARVNGRFADIDALMQRRHIIVHQADRNPQRGRGVHRARHITVHMLRNWIDAVRAFGASLEPELRALP